MTRLNVDITNANQPVPEGPYLVQCTKAEIRQAQSSGNDMLTLELRVQEGEHMARKMWENISLSENALFRLQEACDAFGVFYDEGGLDTDEFVGKECVVSVQHEEYLGKTRARVKRWSPKA